MTQKPGAAPGDGAPAPAADGPEQRPATPGRGRSEAGTAALPSDRLLDDLLARLCQVMSADLAQILLVDGDVLRVVASHGVPADAVGPPLPIGTGFAGTVAAAGSPGAIADTTELAAFGAGWAEAGARALVGVPLAADGRVVGVALVGSRTERSFGSEDISLLSAAAERAAWAVENGILLAAEQRAWDTARSVSERISRLRDIAQELLTDMTVESVVSTVVERGLSLIGAFGGAVWQVDGDRLRLRGMLGYPSEVQQRWQDLPVDADVPSAVAARTGERVVLRSVAERDARFPQLRGAASAGEAMVAAPLVVDGTTIGVLALGFDRADDLDDEGLVYIDAATAQCAAAMHRALVVESQQRSLVEADVTARRLAALQRTTAVLADVREAPATVDLIVRELTEAMGARQVALYVLDEAAGVMRAARLHGLDPALEVDFGEVPYQPGLPVTDALLTRRPVLLADVADRDRLYPSLADRLAPGYAWAALPLVIGDRAIGSLAVSLPAPQEFTPDEVEFFAALADQCGHALERARLIDNERATRTRLEILAEAGRIFTAPLDVRLTSSQFCRLVVGRIGDALSVHLREAPGRYSLAAAEHVDAEQAVAQRLVSTQLPDSVLATWDRVLDDGQSVLFTGLTPEVALAGIDDEAIRSVLARRPATSSILLPLVAGGRPLGVLTVTTVAGGLDPLSETDREQMEELAGRLALAIDSARLLRQQTEIAHTLQRSLLPSSLPRVPGAEVAVRYLPGTEGVDVGGDFYDVIPLPSGRIGLVVGDVMGRGVRAAAVMGQLRAAVRSYCLEGHPPAALLTRLDRLVETLDEGLLVTALYAEWDPARMTVRCASAGHLPPLLRLPGRPPEFVDVDPGVPLGVGGGGYAEVELDLPPGALLLAYTDGLVEGPDLPVEVGMTRLAESVGPTGHAIDACDAALEALRPAAASRRYDDDTALLALVTHADRPDDDAGAPEPGVVTRDLPADNSSPAAARALVVDVLLAWELGVLADPAALLVSELVTNGVRHAGTGLRVSVRRLGSSRVRVAVTDRAPLAEVRVRQSPDDDEGGRGLFLVERLSAGWGSAANDAGKTVWFELQA